MKNTHVTARLHEQDDGGGRWNLTTDPAPNPAARLFDSYHPIQIHHHPPPPPRPTCNLFLSSFRQAYGGPGPGGNVFLIPPHPSLQRKLSQRRPIPPGARVEAGAISSAAPHRAIPVIITFRSGLRNAVTAATDRAQIRLTADRPGRPIGDPIPRPLGVLYAHARGRGGESKEPAPARAAYPSHRRGAHTETAKGAACSAPERSHGEVHAQVQAGGRGRGRRRGHAGRRRPDQVPGGRGGRRRRFQEEEAAAAQLAGLVVPRRPWPERELLPQAAEPHALHGPAGARVGCCGRARARAGAAPGRPLALLQHGLVRGRVRRAAGPEPAFVVRLRRRCQGRLSGGLGQQQLGERRQPREARDDAVQPIPRGPERPGVGSGGAQQRPLITAANTGCRGSSGRREGEDPGGGRDRGVLRRGRAGRGQALRLQVQLRRDARRAPGLRPVRVEPGGEQQLAS